MWRRSTIGVDDAPPLVTIVGLGLSAFPGRLPVPNARM
jgi:hypothetical protein